MSRDPDPPYDRAAAALPVGRSDDVEAARDLIARRRDVGQLRDALTDPANDLGARA